MKKFFAEFKAFIKKGNVVDLAVALVIGTAFNKIVSSLVNDIIMPLVSLMVGGKDVTDWKWVIQKAVYDADGNIITAETALKYGVFIQAIIDFLIIALTVFIIVKLFKASTQKLAQISQTIINETKELTKKQIKALKKLQKKATKQAKKEGKSIDEVLIEKTEEIEAITNTSTEQASKQDVKTETSKTEPVKEEPKAEVKEEVKASADDNTVTKEDEMLLVLREIRDSLKTNNK
ncbi:MAG: large conductance mechanosensitive channel protein MscL [Clostridia bacterium]|nr:large conductance mechanosensitive channel protein MscL [Clostridia bacterium]